MSREIKEAAKLALLAVAVAAVMILLAGMEMWTQMLLLGRAI